MSATSHLQHSPERRHAQRHRCLRMARCVFNHGQSDLEVVLRNLSDTGARVMGSELIWLPEEFELHIKDGSGEFEKHRVRRAWLTAEAAGLEFVK